MHLQLFHVAYFKIESIEPSNRPKGISSFKSNNSKIIYRNALIVFTSIENNDNLKSVITASREIRKIYDNLNNSSNKGCKQIVIIPYSHQRNILKNSKQAKKLIDELYNSISSKKKFGNVFLGDFGFSNKWSMSVKSHKLSCLYREA